MTQRQRGPLPDDEPARGERFGTVSETTAAALRLTIKKVEHAYPYDEEQEPRGDRNPEPLDEQESKMDTEFLPPTTEEASTNFYWTFGKDEVFNLQTTVRGAFDAGAVELHLGTIKAVLLAVVKAGGHAKQVGRQDAPTLPAPGPVVSTTVVAPGVPPAPGPVGAPPANPADVQEMTTNLLKIEPQADGKVKLGFWNAGRKYAEIQAVKKSPQDALALLRTTGAWTVEHMQKAAEYPLPMRIEWRYSENKNANGNPYKNIVSVHPA